VGLTGNTGSGKSIVAQILKDRGAEVIDADSIGQSILLHKDIKARLSSLLGTGIFNDDGEIDRDVLGKLVFSDNTLLKNFNSIVHPLLLNLLREKIEELKKSGVQLIIVDAALIPEWGFNKKLDLTVVVISPWSNRLKRVMSKFNLNEEEALNRMNSQMPEEERIKYGDIIIENDESVVVLEKRSYELYNMLMERLDVL